MSPRSSSGTRFGVKMPWSFSAIRRGIVTSHVRRVCILHGNDSSDTALQAVRANFDGGKWFARVKNPCHAILLCYGTTERGQGSRHYLRCVHPFIGAFMSRISALMIVLIVLIGNDSFAQNATTQDT